MSISPKNKTIVSTGLICLDAIQRGDHYWLMAGGSALNPLLILSIRGWTAYPLGRIGNDTASKVILQDVARFSLATTGILSDPTIATPIYRMQTTETGHIFQKSCPYCHQPFPPFSPIPDNEIQRTLANLPVQIDVCLIERISPFAIELAKQCHQKGAIIVFEPNRIEPVHRLEELLPFVHVLKYSSERIPLLAGIENRTLHHSVRLEIQTLAEYGLQYRISPSPQHTSWKKLEAVPCGSFADASGAGDWTTAVWIDEIVRVHALTEALNNIVVLEEILQKAQRLAALNCETPAPRSRQYSPQDIITIDSNRFCDSFCQT